MIPGSNLLNRASRLIALRTVQYKQFISRSVNEIGYDVSVYAEPVDIRGSWQAVNRSVYQQYGLDFQKNYTQLYTTAGVIDLARDVSGDQIIADGKVYQCISEANWLSQDGWIGVLCVEIDDE